MGLESSEAPGERSSCPGVKRVLINEDIRKFCINVVCLIFSNFLICIMCLWKILHLFLHIHEINLFSKFHLWDIFNNNYPLNYRSYSTYTKYYRILILYDSQYTVSDNFQKYENMIDVKINKCSFNNCYSRCFFCANSSFYYLKMTDLIYLLKQEFNFFNSTPAKSKNIWLKLSFYVSSNSKCRYTINTRVFTAHLWFSGEWLHHYIVCLYISFCFHSQSGYVVE